MDVWGVQMAKKLQLTEDQTRDADYGQIVKRPLDSMLTLILPFKSDPKLREQYQNFFGQLRMGKLLEDFDAFAGNIAYVHCGKEYEHFRGQRCAHKPR